MILDEWRAMKLESQLVFHLALLLSKTLDAATPVVAKEALNSSGIPVLLIHLYTNLCCCSTLLLAAYLIERKKIHRPLSQRNAQLSVLATGTLNFATQLSALYALDFTSPQLIAVIFSTVPALASFIAIVFRVENVPLTRYDGQVKVLSILIACCGALVMAMYQGSKLLGGVTGVSQWQLGSLLITFSSFLVAISLNIQAPLLKAYQTPWSVMAGISLTSTALSTLTCIVLVKEWPLPSPLVLLQLVYSGVVGSAVAFGITAWVLSKAGPLLVYCYLAVAPILTTIMSILFLGTSLYLGSVLGTLLVICGVLLCGWSESESKKLSASASLHESLGDDV